MSDEYIPGVTAANFADDLQEHWLAGLDLDALEQGEVMRAQAREGIFTQIDFHWRTMDAEMVEQVRQAADVMASSLYAEAMGIVNELYCKMRTPMVDENGFLYDHRGAQMFEMDARGYVKESVDQLTGQDIEQTLLDLARVRFVVAPMHNQILSEAIAAYNIWEARRAESHGKNMSGTQTDKAAKASRETRRDKFHAWFRYSLYLQSQAFLQELSNFERRLDRMVERRVWSSRRKDD